MITHFQEFACEVAGACAYIKGFFLVAGYLFVYGLKLGPYSFLLFFAVNFRVDGFVVFCFASVDFNVSVMYLFC